jgi:hypothetical protein
VLSILIFVGFYIQENCPNNFHIAFHRICFYHPLGQIVQFCSSVYDSKVPGHILGEAVTIPLRKPHS